MAMLLLMYVGLREAMVVNDRQRWWYMPGMMVVAATVHKSVRIDGIFLE